MSTVLPLARTEELIVVDVTDETLVQDLNDHQAHCLNPIASLVWKHCDGKTTVKDIARLVSQELGTTVDEANVWLALHQLSKKNLLQEKVKRPADMQISRRELMRGAGTLAGVALITSIVAPTAAMAATGCTNTNSQDQGSCPSGQRCISGSCEPCIPSGQPLPGGCEFETVYRCCSESCFGDSGLCA